VSLNILASIFASDILPIFIIAGIGFLLARRLKASVTTVAHISFYALSPCLVFNMLVTSAVSGREVGRMALAAVAIMAGMSVLARLVAVPLALSRAELSAFMLVVVFSNSGNYGLPVLLFAFGNEALSFGIVFFVTTAILTYTAGVFLAAAGRQTLLNALIGVAKVPAIYGVAAALLVLSGVVTVPDSLMRPAKLLSDAALPVMVLVLGMQLERAKAAARRGPVAIAVVLSLVAAPLVALELTSLLGLTGPARQAAVLLSSMPTAVITTILALEYDVAPSFVTSVVFLTTLLSPLTLTPLIAYLRLGN
jgi:predicted permease